MPSPGPIPCSYWLIEGKLLAGEYPGTYIEAETREKLTKFLEAGIRTFINLTEERELTRYDDVLQALSDERGVETTHIRAMRLRSRVAGSEAIGREVIHRSQRDRSWDESGHERTL